MKKVILTSLSLIAFGTIITGCTAKGPQFTEFEKPKEGKSNIYIYRKAIFAGDGLRPTILIGKEALPELLPDGYIMKTVDVGSYRISAKTEVENDILINTESSGIYCIQHYITPGFFVGHPQFESQDLAKCRPEILKTKLSTSDNTEEK